MNQKKVQSLISHFLPEDKVEAVFLVLLMLLYFSYSIIIINATSIIDHPTILQDIYLSFDNQQIFKGELPILPPHPLLKFIIAPVVFIGDLIVSLTGVPKAKTYFWCILCNYIVASSNLFILKYLKNVVKLDSKVSLLISILFSVTAACLFLSFTPESYTFSFYVITFSLYYGSWCIENKKSIPVVAKVVWSSLAAGITLTNIAISSLPYLYLKEPLRKKVKDLAIVATVIALIILWIGLKHHFIADTRERMMYFGYITGTFYEHVIDLFWGTPILASELYIHQLVGLERVMISMGYYHHWWQYAIICVFSIFVVVSFVKNYRNSHVQILFLIILYNIVIHIFLKYGLEEPFIYAAHWIYIIPLLFGWFYKSFSPKFSRFLLPIFGFLFICLLFNNIYFLYNFIQKAIEIYPA